MKAFKVKKVVILALGLTLLSVSRAFADQLENMFSHRSNNDGLETSFVRSNVEGLFDGQKIQRKVSDRFSFEMVNLKTMHKELDSQHRNTLEDSTLIDVNFAGQWFNRIQLGNSQQDISVFNQASDYNIDRQRMSSIAQGWRGSVGELDAETSVGLVQCANHGQEKYFPIFGLSIGKTFEDNSFLKLNIAQEIQGGGSFTGIYGNQLFKKAMVNARISVMKKLSFLWDAGIGVSESTFNEEVAGVSTMGVSLEYALGKNIKGSIGYSHRNLIDMTTGSINAEGHMMNASLAIANF